MAGLPLTCCPTAVHSRFDGQPFRVLLVRRLGLRLPCSVRNCRCDHPLDSGGRHCADCVKGGVLGWGALWRLSRRASLSGSRRQCLAGRAVAGCVFGPSRRPGQPSSGDRGGRSAIVPRCTVLD